MAPIVSQHPLDLSGRTILVTGASSGIGRETAVLLAQLGARLILVGRNAARLQATRQSLVGDGHLEHAFDLAADPDGIPGWMNQLAAQVGPMAGLAHCAGVQLTQPLMAAKAADYDRLHTLHVVVGAMLAKGLRQRTVVGKSPSVVFVSSVRGLTGEAAAGAYCASKGAMISLARSLAVELAPQGIRVNCVAPGYVETAMTDDIARVLTGEQLERMKSLHPLGTGTPRDVANAMAFLLSDAARWITGTTLVVDGGYTAR